MIKLSSLQKRALLCALFLLSGCSKPCPKWQFETANSSEPVFCVGTLSLKPENIFREVGIEISCHSTMGPKVYLNLYGCPIPTLQANNHLARVILKIDTSDDLIADAFVFKGNQRLLLSDEASEKLIQALLSKQSVTISLGNYSSEVTPIGFEKNYCKLLKIIKPLS